MSQVIRIRSAIVTGFRLGGLAGRGGTPGS